MVLVEQGYAGVKYEFEVNTMSEIEVRSKVEVKNEFEVRNEVDVRNEVKERKIQEAVQNQWRV